MSNKEQLWMDTVVASVRGLSSNENTKCHNYYDISSYAVKIANHVTKEYEKRFEIELTSEND